MSTIYKRQWSDRCELRHFHTAEQQFPGIAGESLLWRAEEIAQAERKQHRALELQAIRERHIMESVDWDD